MRLICPNCSAQYEIDASLVPDEGRDVQCSNCGHTWFELPPPPAEFAEPEAEVEDEAPEAEDEDPAEESSDDTQDEGPSHAALAMEAASEDDDEEDDFFDPPAAAPPPPQQRRPADAAALDILKEEAEREMSQRRAPPSEPMETQTDMGLDEIRNRKTPSRALRARMAHLKETEPADTHDRPRSDPRHVASQAEVISQPDQEGPRRDLLPDIDEINSTLKSTKKRGQPGREDTAQHQKGFRRGFLTMTILAIVLILVYAQAPAIARAIPGSDAALIPYVDGANVIRDWIDELIGNRPD